MCGPSVGDDREPEEEQTMELRHDEAGARFLAEDAGEVVGLIDYALAGDVATFTHTETDPARQGRGIAGKLTSFALDRARELGWRVIPQCPYTARFVADHPEYADLIA
ncbi:GNAT family N-acetyltransferase [Naumannella cuiyingiana]|nr:GNAT family N-acetyltransferase [Naumannella cuiyingiana]